MELGTPRKAGAHRAPKAKSHWPTRLAVTCVCLVVGVGGFLVATGRGSGHVPISIPGLDVPAQAEPAPDRDLPWGPTTGELARARQMVAGWDADKLAGQVIVGRFHGTDPEIAADMVRELHLAGVSLQSENVTDADQVRATTSAVRAVVEEDRGVAPVIGVDQEGGIVAHLDGIATSFPAYAEAGAALQTDRASARGVIRDAARAAALELRSLGFTWVYAPVADIDTGSSTIIGSRAPSADPELAAAAVRASVTGYNEAGVVSTVKHFVGHGRVTGDSHEELPVLDTPVEELRASDIWPFRAAVDAGAPAIMMSHLALAEVDPDTPASLSSAAYGFLAQETGFDGLVITDSLGMGALAGRTAPAVQALNAGADLLLMPSDTALAHATLARAIRDGDVPRARAEDAAATVVAVQLWQARVSGDVPVPDDVTQRAEMASARLEEAG